MSKNTPFILSVRLMTFNHVDYILQAMESIDSQKTDFDFEVVVGDDFSTDGTIEIVKSFQSKNPKAHWKIISRVKGDQYYLDRQSNGRVQNFYDILINCSGKYIALLDGDDYWTDDLKLQKQVDFLESRKEAVGCFHNSIVVDETNKLKWARYFEGVDGRSYNQYDSVSGLRSAYSTGSLVFRNDAIKPYLDDFLKIGTDFILEVLITNRGDLFFMDQNMSAYRFHEGGVWQGSSNEKNEMEIIKRFLFLFHHEPYRSRYNSLLWNEIMDRYHNLLSQTKDQESKQAINDKIYKFLNYSELRTYKYFFNRMKTSMRYRRKKIIASFKK
ncbi:glycosyltransferase [Jejudonia soesokkakensis]|uniref:Glycosyltransferase n=1 Tax=Jejudonia soesokkakensis TaxID=1323432 RepID=A0ABW2MSS2_9FLAO